MIETRKEGYEYPWYLFVSCVYEWKTDADVGYPIAATLRNRVSIIERLHNTRPVKLMIPVY